jgi:predicted transcriptional regulator
VGHHPHPPQCLVRRLDEDIAAVLFTCGRKPEAAIVAEAVEKGIMLLSTPFSTYEAAGKLWKAGLR